MIRKLSLAVSIALGAASLDALALGLGDITTRSSLYERFNADIALLAVKKGEISSVKVELAAPADFERAGIERNFVLSKLKFEPMQLGNGSTVIRVTSREPIREPYLDFLIEVNWPEGRTVREYTVLLDPPPGSSSQPNMTGGDPRGIPGPVIGMSEPIVTPMKPRGSDPRSAPRSAAKSDVAGAMPPPPGGYGPVQPRETLWSIAKQFKYTNADMNQMVIGILRANPSAFKNGDVNSMARGAMLQIPSETEIRKIDPMQAREEYRAQLAAWQPSGPTASGTVVRPKDSGASAKPPKGGTSGGGKLTIDAAPTAVSGDAARRIAMLEQDLASANEAAQTASNESLELRQQLAELQDKIAAVEQMLAEKEAEIQRLSKQGGASGGVADGGAPPKPVEPTVKTPPEPPKMAAAPVENPSVDSAQVGKQPEKPVPPAAKTEPASVKPETPPKVPEQTAKVAGSVTRDNATPGSDQIAQAKLPVDEIKPGKKDPEPPKPPDAKPPPPPPPPPEPGLVDMLLDNLPLIAGALGGLAAIGGGVWFLRNRRRGGRGNSEPESILMSDASHGESEIPTDDNPLSGLTTEETSFLDSLSSTGNFSDDGDLDEGDETSFLSDFVPSDIEALQEETGEVDPLAEADVYIAYGRFKQAEELLRQALDKDGSRADYRFKLFEVLHAAKDSTGFSRLMAESANLGLEDSNPDDWDRVREMDQELSNGGGGSPVADLDTDLTGDSDDADEELDLDFSDLNLGDTSKSSKSSSASASESLDGLDLTGLVGDSAAAASASIDTDDTDMDFDLNFSEDTPAQVDDLTEDISEEFALDLGADEDVASMAGLAASDDLEITNVDTGDGDDLDFDLDSALGGDEPAASAPAASAAASDVDPEEVETKLDLARAYVDMGDEDGARDILNEVLNEGTAEQKAAAQQILSQIG